MSLYLSLTLCLSYTFCFSLCLSVSLSICPSLHLFHCDSLHISPSSMGGTCLFFLSHSLVLSVSLSLTYVSAHLCLSQGRGGPHVSLLICHSVSFSMSLSSAGDEAYVSFSGPRELHPESDDSSPVAAVGSNLGAFSGFKV